MKKLPADSQPFLLAAQTLIVGERDSYHDYRDYIFSLTSSSFLKHSVVRINLERGVEYIDEIRRAVTTKGFKDAEITSGTPKSWSQYFIDYIDEIDPVWTMLFPGDHIFISDDQDKLLWYLKEADRYNAVAVSYGHVQDWDFLIDWQRVKIIEDNQEYIVIEWGWRRFYSRNQVVVDDILHKLDRHVVINPVPGYMVFRSEWLKNVLSAIPKATRWHDIEHAFHPKTLSYRVLIPKTHLYRHVHGYWIEHYFEIIQNKITRKLSTELALENMYIRPNYDWHTHKPSPDDYLNRCEQRYPYLRRYRETKSMPSIIGLPVTTFLNSSRKNQEFYKHLVNTILNMRDDFKYLMLIIMKLVKIK